MFWRDREISGPEMFFNEAFKSNLHNEYSLQCSSTTKGSKVPRCINTIKVDLGLKLQNTRDIVPPTVNICTQVVADFFENELNLSFGRRRIVGHLTRVISRSYSKHPTLTFYLL